ncbi:Vps10 Domain-Containing Receptor Sorcs2 [Manis pentadactyla]|nr:Vps10 Domain-Containing Receptor Sorcs2 [Manis pentadactyla]
MACRHVLETGTLPRHSGLTGTEIVCLHYLVDLLKSVAPDRNHKTVQTGNYNKSLEDKTVLYISCEFSELAILLGTQQVRKYIFYSVSGIIKSVIKTLTNIKGKELQDIEIKVTELSNSNLFHL